MLTIDLSQQQSTLRYGINGQLYTEAFDLVTSRPHFGGCAVRGVVEQAR